jgi:glyoxylase-like metal-dependent hydrolase (beta-lactamase superfamily II)
MSGGWYVDDMVIYRIVEEQRGSGPIERFFPGVVRKLIEDNLYWFASEGLDPSNGNMLLSYHAFVVKTPRHNVLIDSCIGKGKNLPMMDTWHNRTDERWMDEFKATGLNVEDIDYVLCTHLHADHVGWNTLLQDGKWVPTFPNARHLMVDKEYALARNWIKEHGAESGWAQTRRSAWEESITPIIDAGKADFVEATHILDEYFRLMPTPGHTPGHVAVSVGREWDRAVFTGDLIHSPIQARFPDIPMFADEDPALAAVTRREFLKRFAETDTLFCTMHFPAPSVGYLRNWNDGYRLDFVEPGVCTARSPFASFA